MSFPRLVRRFWQEPDVPAEIYISLVDSLYSEPRPLFFGLFATTFAAFATAWKTDEPYLFLCGLAMVAISGSRMLDFRAYTRRRVAVANAEDASDWEARYASGALLFHVTLGIWAFLSFALTADKVAHLFALASTLGYMVGISGRNFGNERLVTWQVIAAGGPLSAGVIMQGGLYYIALALFLVPFFVSLRAISRRLRRMLLDAVIATRDMSQLARRFDTALNNMPHGLCMLNADRQVMVSNNRLSELLGLSPDTTRNGLTVRSLLFDCVHAGTITRSQVERLVGEFEQRLTAASGGKLFLEVSGGRTLDVTFQPMENGGSVILVEDITERRRAEAKIRHLARYDAVTGLPNRRHFREEIERMLGTIKQSGGACAILFIDLDQFKQVNDTLGHPCGDQLLCAVADRLRTIVRPSDVLARFGGDEFIILQSAVGGHEDAGALAGRIVELLGGAYEIEGHEVVIGASVGIAMAPRDGSDADRLLKNADMALYRAKSDGRSAWRFFEQDMDVAAQARRKLELDLRNALATGAFEVFYQPLLNLKTKRISTCEALLRWPHPERGMVSPGEFIPVAEEMGLIVEIGNWVIREVCLEAMRWPQGVRAAVNMSSIQFRRGNVAEVVRGALEASGLAPDRLEIEITESVLIQDTQAARTTLEELRAMGVRISLDDFGTGYSSLSYLHSFPLHKVKIDRSFLEGLGSSKRSLTLLKGVAQLSGQLGLSVAVEGIETEEQLAFIACEDSVEEAQGYLFSPAVPARRIRELLVASAGGKPALRAANADGSSDDVAEAIGW